MSRRSPPIPPRRVAAPPPAAVAGLLRQALAEHRQGRLEEAKRLYEAVLKVQPGNADVLHLLGVVAAQGGDHRLAVSLMDRAIAANPDNAAFHSNRGNALKDLGRLDEALAAYERAVALKPDYADALSNRGNVLLDLGRFDAALASYDQAVALAPGHAKAHSNRAAALLGLGRAELALASCDRAIACQPDYAEAYFNRANALVRLGRLDEALAAYAGALARKPDYAQAHCNRGNVLLDLERPDEALASYDRAIAVRPGYAEAYSNRGVALNDLGRPDEALASYDKAIALRPDYAEAYSNRGNALKAMSRLDAALASYDRAIALRPDYAEAHWNKSLALLLTGELASGWREYEWRWRREKDAPRQRHFSQPVWLGGEAAGRTILLHAEQGLGDTIQFCRYAPRVAELGARVILEVPGALVDLMRGLPGVADVVAAGAALPAFDRHCPLMSLPLAFGTTLAGVPSAPRYLYADSARVAEWHDRLGPSGQPRVGLAWSGNTAHKQDRNRTLALDTLLPYLPEGCEYVCIQKELRAADRAILAGHGGMRFFGDELRDFADTAALCAQLDVVISVDTSVAHLAAALGKETWILLPQVPDWRWLLGRDDSPWYPSARLYRQTGAGDWAGVLARLQGDLRVRLAAAREPGLAANKTGG
ncbi:tetratricopeptide repeat protein [Parasulfuritortus cantonensis]|nr:tetratricopeptide repeat protein [Parasulfuritortus cantonensis]